MNAQQLKNSILQMAVQGKLVPQDPNDEPASVLLERIRAEKEKLIKDGKIKKEKNPSYIFRGEDNLPYEKVGKNEPVCLADEVPFEIPDSWEWVRLGTVVTLQSGQDLTPDKYNDKHQGMPYITGASNIIDSNVIINRWTEYGRAFAYKGDLLLTCKGTVGTMAFLEDEQVHIARQIMAIRPYGDINPFYIRIVLESLVEQLKAAAKSMIPGIAREDVLNAMLPLPPFNEQARIVARYDTVLPHIKEYEIYDVSICDLNRAFPELLKKSILQRAVMGRLVPQDPNDEPASVLLEKIRAEKDALIKAGKLKKDKHESIIYRRDNSHYEKLDGVDRCIDDEIPFEIPDSWAWVRFGNVINLQSGQDLTPDKYNEKCKGIPYITGASNIEDAAVLINRWTEYGRAFAYRGDLLLTCKGTVGTMAFLSEDKVHIARQIMSIQPYNGIDSKYVRIVLESLVEGLKAVAKSMIPGISREDVLTALFPLPPINEQRRISKMIDVVSDPIGNL